MNNEIPSTATDPVINAFSRLAQEIEAGQSPQPSSLEERHKAALLEPNFRGSNPSAANLGAELNSVRATRDAGKKLGQAIDVAVENKEGLQSWTYGDSRRAYESPSDTPERQTLVTVNGNDSDGKSVSVLTQTMSHHPDGRYIGGERSITRLDVDPEGNLSEQKSHGHSGDFRPVERTPERLKQRAKAAARLIEMTRNKAA